MKTKFYLIISLALFMTSCFGSRDYIVESDYSYSGNFKKYKTFNFLDHQRFDLDSLIPEDLIMQSIKSRMSILGYEHSETKPNLLIAFRLFYNDFTFNGWSQPEIELWLEEEGYIEEEFEEVKYKMKEGTLMIFLLDRKQKKAVWQGYNSGLINVNALDNERFIRGSVRLIFEKYRVFAEGYLRDS
jgi:hypothetical protein